MKRKGATGKVESCAKILEVEKFSFQRAISKFVSEHDIPLDLVLKGATKLYFMRYSRVVIILFSTDLYNSVFSTYSFGKTRFSFFCVLLFHVSIFWLLVFAAFACNAKALQLRFFFFFFFLLLASAFGQAAKSFFRNVLSRKCVSKIGLTSLDTPKKIFP